MSYLIENSDIVTKKAYEEDEEKYESSHKYPLGDYYILTNNSKPFFSIFDIANFCKKRYKKEKLFLIVHRYFDKVANEKITEFYIFNTINIFDKALTSFLLVKEHELVGKQKVIKNNIFIAQKLLNVDNVHIILGDNVKEHEIVEYLNLEDNSCEVEFFEEGLYNPKEKFKNVIEKYKTPETIRVSRISRILNSIRILEPQDSKLKRMAMLIIISLFVLYFVDDYLTSELDDYEMSAKKEIQKLNQNLSKQRQELEFKQANLNDQNKILEDLKQRKVYAPTKVEQ